MQEKENNSLNSCANANYCLNLMVERQNVHSTKCILNLEYYYTPKERETKIKAFLLLI